MISLAHISGGEKFFEEVINAVTRDATEAPAIPDDDADQLLDGASDLDEADGGMSAEDLIEEFGTDIMTHAEFDKAFGDGGVSAEEDGETIFEFSGDEDVFEDVGGGTDMDSIAKMIDDMLENYSARLI